MKRILPLGFLVIFSLILLPACAGEPAQSQEPVKYTLDMTEYAFSPAELKARVGQEVTIELVNSGQIEHEFMVGREVKRTNNRPDGYEHSMFEEQQPQVLGGQVGETGAMGVHYDAGMKGKLVVSR